MEYWQAAALVAVGFMVGFINVFAGSGSVLSLPLLMFLGLPVTVANGTNRIAILLQNVVGAYNFKKQGNLELKDGLKLSIPSMAGALVGSMLAAEINEALMQKIVGIILLILLIITLLKKEAWTKTELAAAGKTSFLQYLVLFFIGIYGGFIQIGTGLFLLFGLVLSSGYNILKANALKMFIILMYTPLALGIFIYNGQVNFKWGLLLAVGTMLGAYVASRLHTKLNTKIIRYFIVLISAVFSIKLLIFS